jgi:hypothetical protein
MGESDLIKACLDYFALKKILAWRNNSGAMKYTYTRRNGQIRNCFMRFGAVGSPDIIAVIKGQFVGVECKDRYGKQSPAQKEFEANLKKAGGKYFLIRTIEELVLKLL